MRQGGKRAKLGYVIHQNITLETWRHWFPRHACTVLHLLVARWRTQCPQLATHSAAVTFFSCCSSGQSEAANSSGWAGILRADAWRFRSSRQSHAPTTKHGSASVRNILSFACFFCCIVGTLVKDPRSSRFSCVLSDAGGQTNSAGPPTPVLVWPSNRGRGSESRVLYRGTSSSRECRSFGPVHTSSPNPADQSSLAAPECRRITAQLEVGWKYFVFLYPLCRVSARFVVEKSL